MNEALKKELYHVIEYAQTIKSDDRAKKLAVEMWKKTIEKYINSTMVTLEKYRLSGIQRFISNNERELPRDVFFIYMRDVIDGFYRIDNPEEQKGEMTYGSLVSS